MGEGYVGVWVVFKDHSWFVLVACLKKVMGTFDSEIVELLAIKYALQLMINWRVFIAIVESDALSVIY